MKRFSPREFALLCVPVLVVAVAGIVLSRRKAPVLVNSGQRQLSFRVEKPTALEAFKGADVVCVVEQNWIDHTQIYLQLQTPCGRLDSRRPENAAWGVNWLRSTGGDQVWMRYGINLRDVPQGAAYLNVNWVDASGSGAPTASSTATPSGTQSCPINRASIVPFSFQKLPKNPLLVLRSVQITQVPFNVNGMVVGEAIFDLKGAALKKSTVLDVEMRNRSTPVDNAISPQKSSVATRACLWTVFPANPKVRSVASVSGRVSADNRWPLAFQIEPFDTAKVKVGQKLQFKSWPAPVPKS